MNAPLIIAETSKREKYSSIKKHVHIDEKAK
jgi:hypothetical protein